MGGRRRLKKSVCLNVWGTCQYGSTQCAVRGTPWMMMRVRRRRQPASQYHTRAMHRVLQPYPYNRTARSLAAHPRRPLTNVCTHQHLPDKIPRRKPNNKPYKHARNNRHQRLMHRAYPLNLQIIARPEREDKQQADEEQRPRAVEFFELDGRRCRRGRRRRGYWVRHDDSVGEGRKRVLFVGEEDRMGLWTRTCATRARSQRSSSRLALDHHINAQR